MKDWFEIGLSLVGSAVPGECTFASTFISRCSKRILLPYPFETGLAFVEKETQETQSWSTHLVGRAHQDLFILRPYESMSFTFLPFLFRDASIDRAMVNSGRLSQWRLNLKAQCQYSVRFVYQVQEGDFRGVEPVGIQRLETIAYDNFAHTWMGTAMSNELEFRS